MDDFFTIGTSEFCKTSPDLILGDNDTHVSNTIQIHRDGNNTVFQLGSKIPLQNATAQGIVFGEHVPYPISSFRFVLPDEMCSDWLHCDSNGLISMEEKHITGQVVKRTAAICFSISGSSWRKRVNIIIENENGEKAEFTGDLPIVQ